MLLAPNVRVRVFGLAWMTGWPPVGRIAARSTCGLSSFFRLGFWSVNFFLIAPFPDHCLL